MVKKPFIIRVFRDKPRYCRFPIFLGGERQIHIMQPFNEEGTEFPVPQNADEWFKLAEKHGQVVFSHAALEDFIAALRKLKEKQLQQENHAE